MERKPVKSSQILSIGYDPDTNTLEVEFRSKGKPIWQYQPVTSEGFHQLLNAESVGSYFHTNIKLNKLVTSKKIS